MMQDVSLRMGVSESPLPGVSCIPRFSRHSKCLSKKAILSSVQNFVIAIGKPVRILREPQFPRHGRKRPYTIGASADVATAQNMYPYCTLHQAKTEGEILALVYGLGPLYP